MTSKIFIWIYLPGATAPVVAGQLLVESLGAQLVGSFAYGKSYLANEDAIPIDPVTLHLNPRVFKFTSQSGYPGAILDSCPDRWGKKVIDRLYGAQKSPSDYLLRNDPGRSGCLAFSTDPKNLPVEMTSRQFSLSELMQAAQEVEENKPVDVELLKALHPGTGGAHPKCNIEENGATWIAKFPVTNPQGINIPRLEHASMLLAKECGINVAETKITTVNGKDVLLVKRFDRNGVGSHGTRVSYISARSIFFADPGYVNFPHGSYSRIARWLSKYGVNATEKLELYKRMVFNCAIRNSDDHELNHGLLWSGPGKYSLSPAFDVLPKIDTQILVHSHALLVGENADGTVENLLSNCDVFDLDVPSALKIIEEIEITIKEKFHDAFYSAGFGDMEISQIEQFFKPLPIEKDSVPSFGMNF